VKDFAARMIKDHSKQVDTLAKEAGNLVSAGTARNTDERREVRKVPLDEPRREERKEAREDRREGREEVREERTTTVAGQRPAFNWVTIHRELADECLQSAKKELSGKEGSEFDQCYMGMQIGAHMKMLDELKVFKNHATGRLQQDIEDGISTTEEHLKEAKSIYDKLAGTNTSKSERKNRDEK
jgi:predicted outer membrane protein